MHSLDIKEILELLPHRYPFLLVDRVLDFCYTEEKKVLKAVKNVSFNEPFFQGHFPGKPVFPGVLILEALAQATGILSFKVIGKPKDDELYYFAAIDGARFKRPVLPGDQLVLDVELIREVRGIAKFKGVATVDGELVCSAELMCAKRKA
ncbi:MAG: 3-hydroxyacyl-ACP dehydratase FabZ [Succinivibrionaceae bacterium]